VNEQIEAILDEVGAEPTPETVAAVEAVLEGRVPEPARPSVPLRSGWGWVRILAATSLGFIGWTMLFAPPSMDEAWISVGFPGYLAAAALWLYWHWTGTWEWPHLTLRRLRQPIHQHQRTEETNSTPCYEAVPALRRRAGVPIQG
jgi:hypothetical protein